MKFLYIGSCGFEDPTRAGLNLMMAKGAHEAGFDVEIVLQNNAVSLLNPGVAEHVKPVGLPFVSELLDYMKANAIPVYG